MTTFTKPQLDAITTMDLHTKKLETVLATQPDDYIRAWPELGLCVKLDRRSGDHSVVAVWNATTDDDAGSVRRRFRNGKGDLAVIVSRHELAKEELVRTRELRAHLVAYFEKQNAALERRIVA